MAEQISCRTTELLINDFINGSLIDEDLYNFLIHVRNCPSCYEELETQYLLVTALSKVENGENFDLASELKVKIKNATHALKLHHFVGLISRTLEVVAGVLVAFELVRILSVYLR